MANMITVNGSAVEVVNTLSCGPGCAAHTYELKGGSYVYQIGADWFLQVRGQSARKVEVAPVAKVPSVAVEYASSETAYGLTVGYGFAIKVF